jgi:hypothetical protein
MGGFSFDSIPPALLYAAGGGVVVVLLLAFFFLGGKKPGKDPEEGLQEILADIPAPTKGERHYQLYVMNIPVRVRLIAIAPMGKKTVGKPEVALEQILPNLGEVSFDDRPRIRVWPPQLSKTGFAPTFFRLTKKPDADGKPSKWILLAGPARSGSMPVLLGMAVLAETANKHGLLTMTETQWAEAVRIEEI